jgi:hypothetical protein
MAEEAVRAAFVAQVGWCTRLGSPFTARLCEVLARRLDRSTKVGRRLLDWPGDPAPEADNVPARLCGALHFLARSGEAPGLARLYPPAPPPDEESLWAEIAPLLSARAATIESFLDNAPQTNEIGRSSVLMAGLMVVAESFDLPMRLFELGSSAGLNLLLDRYAFDLGGRAAGDPASPVRLAPLWTGPPPPAAKVRIVERRGVDISPRDPRADGERLLAFVWPDQTERIDRLEAALAIAAADPPAVDRADAADWLERVLPEAPRDGAVRVVLHSIAFQYFPEGVQRRIAALIERLGREATAEAPLAWLRYEYLPGEEQASLRLRTWPGTERQLAWAHGHGTNVEWLATASGRERP